MKVLIRSKIVFDDMMKYQGIDDSNVESKDIMFISICSPKDDDQPYISSLSTESYFKEEHSNVKIMYFGDYTSNDLNNPYVFTIGHAKELYEFIKRNKDKSMAILHCGAGISRSGAIGTFIFDLYGNGDYEEFKRKNSQIYPNHHILRLLNNVHEQQKRYNK